MDHLGANLRLVVSAPALSEIAFSFVASDDVLPTLILFAAWAIQRNDRWMQVCFIRAQICILAVQGPLFENLSKFCLQLCFC